jgi:hypothetical protein
VETFLGATGILCRAVWGFGAEMGGSSLRNGSITFLDHCSFVQMSCEANLLKESTVEITEEHSIDRI